MGHWVEKKANEGHVIIPFFWKTSKKTTARCGCSHTETWLEGHTNLADAGYCWEGFPGLSPQALGTWNSPSSPSRLPYPQSQSPNSPAPYLASTLHLLLPDTRGHTYLFDARLCKGKNKWKKKKVDFPWCKKKRRTFAFPLSFS